MLYVYIGCFTFGILYSLVSLLLSSNGFDGDGADSGDFDFSDGIDSGSFDAQIDATAQGDLDVQTDAATDTDVDTPSPFSPIVIASAITTFGAVGLIGKLGFRMSDVTSAVVSLGFAGSIGMAIFFGIVKFMYSSQSNSIYSQDEIVGFDAEVITPIPPNGLGEIAYVINGTRYNLSAKSADGEKIGRGETVKIRSVSGNLAIVSRKMTLEDYDRIKNAPNSNEEMQN
ncbi:MAG TPA: hypothetical protein GXX36_09275 [Clostridiaceae bacterium]|nr:hypothetical protein [Clostridiaceae bacterium]